MAPIPETFRYDVFLSFRGVDTRNNFTSHLYGALTRHNFDVFHDTTLQPGVVIVPQLMEAINKSKIFVVIFSTNYADSTFCMDELAEMMHCVDRNPEQIILPVFLDVNQSDVTAQQGSYEKPFTDHEKKFNQNRVEDWKKGLRRAGTSHGLSLQNDANLDRELLKNQIVEKVRNLVPRLDMIEADMSFTKGIESRIQDVISLLNNPRCDNGNGARVIAICGPEKIGKTTIAKATYDHLTLEFKQQYSCFLPDVKTTFKGNNGKVALQKMFLSNLGHHDIIHSYHEGIAKIKKKIEKQKVLLVLDDIDHDEHLEILGMNNPAMFGPGSRVIVTTRDASFVGRLKPDAIHEPRLLDERESLHVLCWNAFGQKQLKEEYKEYEEALREAVCWGAVCVGVLKDQGLKKEYEEVLREAVCWGNGRVGVLKDLAVFLKKYRTVEQWRCALEYFMKNHSS